MERENILKDLCMNDDFSTEYREIIEICIKEFIKLNPSEVMHAVVDNNSPHQERDLFSHTVLALQALRITDKYLSSCIEDKVRLIIAVMLHDVGKAIQWKSIDTSTGKWHFRGHDTVGACWFRSLVKKNGWDQNFYRPVFLAIWFHMVKSKENIGLLSFLREHNAIEITECLHCADNYGRLEVQDVMPEILTVPTIPEKTIIPNLPIVVYICGKSGSGKTTLARTIMEELSDVSTGYVCFDRTLLRVIGNIDEPWADCDSNIRGNNLKSKSQYKTIFDIYQKEAQERQKVKEGLCSDFNTSVQNNTVTFVASTVKKPSVNMLPFMSQKQINIVTAPDYHDGIQNFFGSLRMSMEATRRGSGWSAPGALIYVPETELISCIRHIMECRTMKLNPPKISRPSELVKLFKYWKEITGSVDGMKYAIESFYDISVSIFKAAHGAYYNFSYRDGAPYDDPFYPGSQSPAVFCRGTTFHYSEPHDIFELVRLPMNRGKEISFTPIMESEMEDAKIPTIFYSNLVRNAMNIDHLITAKVDGALVIVFVDNHGLEQNPRLTNNKGIIFGTKGLITMNPEITETFCNAVNASGHTIESFTQLCFDYMSLHNMYSLSFEMVYEKRHELVVDYPINYRGLYFLGGSRGDIFSPYFNCDGSIFHLPPTITSSIELASKMLLGPFPEHIEGAVIWVKHNELYYPLKLKTIMYYIMHKRRSRPEYLDYLMDLMEEYGWYAPTIPNKDDLVGKKLILSLFSLVNLPANTLQVLPFLRKSREKYNSLLTLTEQYPNPEDLRVNIDPKDYRDWCRFNSIYGNGQYSKAYELL